MATANMGRPKQPDYLRILNGRGENKDGIPTDSAGAPIPAGPAFTRGLPEKPENLSTDAEWLWDRVIDQMKTIGILKPIDAAALEAACENFARLREAVRMRQAEGLTRTTSQGLGTAPWIGIEERASKEFRAWCSEFGITPAAERNLAGSSDPAAPDKDNPF